MYICMYEGATPNEGGHAHDASWLPHLCAQKQYCAKEHFRRDFMFLILSITVSESTCFQKSTLIIYCRLLMLLPTL